MTPDSDTLVGGAQTTLTATASARADRRDCPSEAWGPRGKTHTPPLDALFGPARGVRAGGRHRGRQYGPEVGKWLVWLRTPGWDEGRIMLTLNSQGVD